MTETEALQQSPDDKPVEPKDVQQYWELFTGRRFFVVNIIRDGLTLFGLGKTGGAAFGDTVTLGSGSVASATHLTLGTGNVFTVTGTTKIVRIAAKPDTAIVVLRFASAGCLVEDRTTASGGAGNVYLTAGYYASAVNSTLTLFCQDGTWYEIARAGVSTIAVQFSRASLFSVLDSTNTYVPWNRTTGWPYGGTGYSPFGDEFKDTLGMLDPANAYEIRLLVPGTYLVLYRVTYKPNATDADFHGRRKVWLEKYDPATALAADPTAPPENYWFAGGDGNEFATAMLTGTSFSDLAWANNLTNSGKVATDTTADYNTASNWDGDVPEVREVVHDDLFQIARKLGKLIDDVQGALTFTTPGDAKERTLVGYTVTRSDGTNKIRLLTHQNSGETLSLSGESYETSMTLVRLGN